MLQGIAIVFVFVFAAMTANRIAARLFPKSALDTLAVGLLLFVSILSLSMTYIGFFNLMSPLPAFITGVTACIVLWVAAPRLSPLESEPTMLPSRRLSSPLQRIVISILGIGAIIFVAAEFINYASSAFTYPGDFVDVQWVYLPDTLNFVQAH